MPSVLLFRPDAAMTGGVVNYYGAVLDKFSNAVAVEEFRVGRRPGFWGHWAFYPLQFLGDCVRLLLTAATRRHDVYHFNPSLNRSAFTRDGILILLLGLFSERRILLFFRGWEDDYFERLVSGRLSRRFFLAVLDRADHILVLASSNQRSLEQLGVPPSKIEVTSTTFDGTHLDRDAPFRAAVETPTFLFMSRLVERKGVHELLDAAVILRQEGHAFRLVIAGAGPAEAGIREHIVRTGLDDLVSLPGYLQGVEKATELMSADIFMLPTYHGEGCPNCILEAMGAGLPVITTRVGGIPDIVQDPDNGVLLNEVSPGAIAQAMLSYLQDDALRERVARANRKKAWERYEANVVASRLETVYGSVVAMA